MHQSRPVPSSNGAKRGRLKSNQNGGACDQDSAASGRNRPMADPDEPIFGVQLLTGLQVDRNLAYLPNLTYLFCYLRLRNPLSRCRYPVVFCSDCFSGRSGWEGWSPAPGSFGLVRIATLGFCILRWLRGSSGDSSAVHGQSKFVTVANARRHSSKLGN